MRLARLPLVALLALVLVACGGSDDKKPVLGGDKPATAESNTWTTLLDAVPDTSKTRKYVVMNDYATLRDMLKLQPPASNDPKEIDDYRRKLLLPGGAINAAMPADMSGFGRSFDPAAWMKELGYNPGQVDADIVAGAPPETYEALLGRFDATGIDTAIDADTSPHRKTLTKTTREGATVYTWGEDQKQDLQGRSPVRPLGRGGRLAVKGNALFWTFWTAGINDMADAAAGKKPSLADADDIKALLSGLAKHSLYTVVLSNETPTPDTIDVVGSNPSIVSEAREASFKEALKPYFMLAFGYGQDAQGPFSVVVLLHTNDALARENVAKLRNKIDTGKSAQNQAPWGRMITSSEINADGRLVIAKLRTTRVNLLTDVFQRRDSLLAHE